MDSYWPVVKNVRTNENRVFPVLALKQFYQLITCHINRFLTNQNVVKPVYMDQLLIISNIDSVQDYCFSTGNDENKFRNYRFVYSFYSYALIIKHLLRVCFVQYQKYYIRSTCCTRPSVSCNITISCNIL